MPQLSPLTLCGVRGGMQHAASVSAAVSDVVPDRAPVGKNPLDACTAPTLRITVDNRVYHHLSRLDGPNPLHGKHLGLGVTFKASQLGPERILALLGLAAERTVTLRLLAVSYCS